MRPNTGSFEQVSDLEVDPPHLRMEVPDSCFSSQLSLALLVFLTRYRRLQLIQRCLDVAHGLMRLRTVREGRKREEEGDDLRDGDEDLMVARLKFLKLLEAAESG